MDIASLRLLSEETGIEGAERLAALWIKKNPGRFKRAEDDAALGDRRGEGKANPEQHARAALRRQAQEALAPKASKQMLRFPKEPQSGGAIHAGAANEVWQVDTAYMTQFQGTHELVKFRGSKDYFMIAVDVFTRFTRVSPVSTVTP